MKQKKEYVEDAVKLAMQEYRKECVKNADLIVKDYCRELEQSITWLFAQPYGKVALEDSKMIGYIAFAGPYDGFFGNVKGVFSPLGGSAFAGERRGMVATRLFSAIAMDLMNDGICSVAMSRYAHDEKVDEAFVMNGFGRRCSDAIRRLGNQMVDCDKERHCDIKELFGEEKQQIFSLKRHLEDHMSSAPIFKLRTGDDEVTKWFANEEKRVFVATIGEELAGFMSLEEEAETFVSNDAQMTNICGAFVEPKFRGNCVAQELVEYLIDVAMKEKREYLGVDFETLNPTALHFWGKYFTSYTYSYARRLDERLVPKKG